MKKLLIASSLLICFSLGAMAHGKHKKHHKKKHHNYVTKKDGSKPDKSDKKTSK